MIDTSKLKAGQKIRCFKDWPSIDPVISAGKDYDIVAITGKTFFINGNRPLGMPGATHNGAWGFGEWEMDKYFTDQPQSRNLPSWFGKPKGTTVKQCDCGFINGVSAAHYHWCSSHGIKSA